MLKICLYQLYPQVSLLLTKSSISAHLFQKVSDGVEFSGGARTGWRQERGYGTTFICFRALHSRFGAFIHRRLCAFSVATILMLILYLIHTFKLHIHRDDTCTTALPFKIWNAHALEDVWASMRKRMS